MDDNIGPSKLKDAYEIYNRLQQIAAYVKDGFFDDLEMTVNQDDNGLKASLDFTFADDQPPVEPERVFTITQTKLHKTPDLSSQVLRYVPRGEILDVETEYNSIGFFQVTYHHKLFGDTTGWISADMIEKYYPCPNEATINGVVSTMLNNQTLHLPQDKQADGSRAKQYITLEAIGFGKAIHYNLCGPFCCAALVNKDVVPMLADWLKTTDLPVYKELIRNDMGLGIDPLLSMLRINGKDCHATTFNTTASILNARVLQTFLNDNYIIAGVGIDRNGIILSNGSIRHYVILLDVYPCGTGGFVMVYNPFQNKIEQVNFDTLWRSMFAGGHAAQVVLVNK